MFISFLAWVIYYQLFVRYDIYELSNTFKQSIGKSSLLIFIVVCLLMPFNWLIETKKWQMLVSKFQQFSSLQSWMSVLSGVSVAILTPGRIGEYGGRLVGIKVNHQPKALLANFVSSLSQNIINISIGLICALLFMSEYMNVQIGVLYSLIGVGIGVLFIFLLAYFRIDLIQNIIDFLPQNKWTNKLSESTIPFEQMNNKELTSVLFYSLFRYLIYVSQYILLLWFFGVTQDVYVAFIGIGTIYFLQSNLPLPPALSVLARGEMAIFLWSYFTQNVLGILAATFSLWLINLVFPAIVGAVIISRTSFTKSGH